MRKRKSEYTFSGLKNHFRMGTLVRSLTGRIDNEDGSQGPESRTWGWGLSLSGAINVSHRNDLDNFKFQVNGGRGIGRYVNDLASVGGQDAVFNPENGDLEALPAFGGYVAYQRWWSEKRRLPKFLTNLRSTLVYSYTNVDNYDYQQDDAYRYTQRMSLNLIMSPISAIDMGLEGLWGERINKDGSRGQALQLQFVATFNF